MGREGRRDHYDDRFDRDDRRRVPTPPPRSGSNAHRQQDDRRQLSVGQRAPVDRREPGFDARSIIVQGLVDGTELIEVAMTEMCPLAAESMFQVQNALAEPSEPQ